MVWNGTIVKEITRFKPGDVTIGEDPRSDFVIPGVGGRFRLFHHSTDKQEPVYLIHLTEQMGGKLTVRDTTMSVRDFVKSPAVHPYETGFHGEVEPGDWGLVSIGDIGFFWQFVPAADKIKRAALAIDRNMVLIAFGILVLAAAVLVTGYALWEEGVRTPPPISLRSAKFMVEKFKEPPKEEQKEEGPKESVGKRHMGKEGKAGEPDKPKHLKTKIPRATQAMIQKVTRIGALGAISSSKIGGPLKEIFSSDTQGFGDKLGAAMDGTGDEFQMGHGTGGWSTKGTGTGGGGTGWGRVYGTSNIDTGGGRGIRARMGRKREKKVKYKMTTAPAEVEGFCAKEAINRVVRAHQGGIRYCFEKELQRDPKLSGKVTMGWKINLQGRVQFAKLEKTTLQNDRVEGCMLRQIRRWIFPPPQGGICVISYPFVFKGGL
jgi:outer membrane biosynthesis protein TonB